MSEIIGSENNWVEAFNEKGLLICWSAVSKGAPLLFTVSVNGISDPLTDILGHVIDRLTEVRSRIEGGRHETGR